MVGEGAAHIQRQSQSEVTQVGVPSSHKLLRADPQQWSFFMPPRNQMVLLVSLSPEVCQPGTHHFLGLLKPLTPSQMLKEFQK